MKRILFILSFACICEYHNIIAQVREVEYYRDVEPVLRKHCYDCHFAGGPAPFDLTHAEQVKKRGSFVAYVTSIRYMPPWKASTDFGTHRNARVLSDEEIAVIKTWVDNGMKTGKPPKSKKKAKVTESQKPAVGTMELFMGSDYRMPSDRKDDFRFFYLPFGNTEEKYITGIEFVAGNKKRVHHSRIMVDTSGLVAGINGLSESDTAIYRYQKKPLADEFLYGWVPGNFTFRFPRGFGKKLHPNSGFLLNMHYAPSSLTETDRSGIRLTLEEAKNIKREVRTFILRENDITNKPFVIPAETEKTFYISSGIIPIDLSLLTVQPHAHLLGKAFRAFAITPDGDLIPLIKIDKWDFNWQTTYEFPGLIHIPAGSVIYMEGTYDNTSSNPVNPNIPPVDTGYGWRTVDEMMNLIFYYTEYQPGDENLILQY